jgi:hypothetical protein
MRPIVHGVRRSVTCCPSRNRIRSAAVGPYRQDGRGPHRYDEEGDDVTEPGTRSDVPDADRAEQEALLDPPAVVLAGDAAPPAEDVPEADAIEQQLAARPGEAGSPPRAVGDREANDADVLEQETDVPVDDDDIVT